MAAIIFDLDGVLIDTEELQYEAYAHVLRDFGVSITVDEYARHWIAVGRGPEYAVRTYRLPVDATALRALKNPVYHESLRRQVRLMPGAVEALKRMREHFVLGLATNSNRTDVEFVVDHFSLRCFFRGIITREDYVRPKPNPDAYLAAATALGVPPHACLIVEDAQRGVTAAHRAGAVPVAVPNGLTRANDFSFAAAILESLDELTVTLAHTLLEGRRER